MRSTTPVRSSELRETDREVKGAVTIVRGIIQTDRQIQLPIVMLLPTGVPNPPLVVAVAREGKDAFLRDRAPDLAKLIQAGIAIALPDLRGCGETRPGTDRGRTSQLTSLSATAQMLDETLLETQVRDLRTVIALLVKQDQFAKSVLALWGESFTPANGDDIRLDVPWDADPLPTFADPWAGLVTMFTAAMTNRVDCLNIRGGLTAYQTMLEGPFFYLPHDCIMPGMLLNCDLPELANGSRTKYLRLEAMVDALTRLVPREQVAKNYKNCQIDNDGRNRAEWLIEKINDLVENPPRLPN